jgi:hypothetical protein
MTVRKFSDSCAVLIELLRAHKGSVAGLDDMTFEERMFLTTTCSVEVLLHSLSIIAGADYDNAIKGLHSINMEKRLKEICDEMEAAA